MDNTALWNNSYHETVLTHWRSFTEKVLSNSSNVPINGRSIDLAAVVAVAR